jgi:hypothetical protein
MKKNLVLGVEAYEGLFEKTPRKKVIVEYSGRFRDYGANVLDTPSLLRFRLSKEFLEVGEEIQIGIVQHLLCKLYHSKRRTLEMDLYDRFLKKVGEYETMGGGVVEDEELQASFDNINKRFFNDFMLAPHIKWAGQSKNLLGNYSFGNDTISISQVLKGAGEILDFVIYHEMLHKKHKYVQKGNRTHSHTPAFRKDEKLFRMADGSDPEKALVKYLRGLARRQKKQKGFVEKLLDYF